MEETRFAKKKITGNLNPALITVQSSNIGYWFEFGKMATTVYFPEVTALTQIARQRESTLCVPIKCSPHSSMDRYYDRLLNESLFGPIFNARIDAIGKAYRVLDSQEEYRA